MKKIGKIISLYLPPILWCFVIFYFSGQPNLRVTSGPWDFILRKLGHIFEYFLLTILVSRAISSSIRQIGIKVFLAGALFSFIFAISDEFHQKFIPGRFGTPGDVGIDSIGIILAGIVFWAIYLFIENRKKS